MALHNPYIRAVYYRKPGTYAYELAAGAHLVPGVNRAYQFLLGTMAGPSSPQVAIFLRENSSIQGRNQIGWHGDHGGASWTAEHIPLIFAGPGVLQGVKSSYPATIYDIAPTILTLLKIQPQGMDGVTLADGLIDPDPALLAAQEQRGAQLAPFVQALQRQSRQDGP
jgi:arylsulfatase A-like enzyme